MRDYDDDDEDRVTTESSLLEKEMVLPAEEKYQFISDLDGFKKNLQNLLDKNIDIQNSHSYYEKMTSNLKNISIFVLQNEIESRNLWKEAKAENNELVEALKSVTNPFENISKEYERAYNKLILSIQWRCIFTEFIIREREKYIEVIKNAQTLVNVANQKELELLKTSTEEYKQKIVELEKNQSFHCNICNKDFRNRMDFDAHNDNVHPKCEICGKVCKDVHEYIKHYNEHNRNYKEQANLEIKKIKPATKEMEINQPETKQPEIKQKHYLEEDMEKISNEEDILDYVEKNDDEDVEIEAEHSKDNNVQQKDKIKKSKKNNFGKMLAPFDNEVFKLLKDRYELEEIMSKLNKNVMTVKSAFSRLRKRGYVDDRNNILKLEENVPSLQE